MSAKVAVADFGVGNLHSVLGALRRVAPGANVVLAQDAETLQKADKVLLPGDGNFDACMRAIETRGLRGVLLEAAESKPFWGICAGMQMLHESSEEGELPGLGIFPGRIRKLPANAGVKVPHMGWNTAEFLMPNHPMLAGVRENSRFYFVHSYYAAPNKNTAAQTRHGVPLAAMSSQNNIFATQFHPEKSATPGEQLLKNFMQL